MDKAHSIQQIAIEGTTLLLKVDDRDYKINIAEQSKRLAQATPKQRQNYEISPSGYGIHWPDVDEDLSIDGLIGIKHAFPVAEKLIKNS